MGAKPDLNAIRLFGEAREAFRSRPVFCIGAWVVFALFGQVGGGAVGVVG